jgi:hypothetical protein
MIRRLLRSRLFWFGLLGLVLVVGAWGKSIWAARGQVWGWSNPARYWHASHGGGWLMAGTRDTSGYRLHPSYRPRHGFRHGYWDPAARKMTWFPPVRLEWVTGGANFSIHYGALTAIWLAGWLVPLIGRNLPRRTRPPRFPGTPRRWWANPILWGGLPGALLVVALWLDSAGHRSYVSWRWVMPADQRYLGFGLESHRGRIVGWAGRAYEGLFTRSRPTGFSGFRRKSTTLSASPETAARRDKRRFEISYQPVTGLYLAAWAALAIGWQRRQARLLKASAAVPPP